MSVDDGTHYELRILFGPMFGVDLLLPKQESVFVFVGPETAQSASQFATNALTIPHHKSGINFRISFDTHVNDSEAADEDDSPADMDDMEVSPQRSMAHDQDVTGDPLRFNVEWINGNDVTVESGVLNSVCQFEDIAFAVRLNDTPWSDAVRQFLVRPAGALETSDVAADLLVPAGHTGRRTRRFAVMACIAVALVALSSGLLTSFFADRARLNQLAAVFDNGTARNELITKDGKVYVIARTQSDLEWNKQIALRFPAAQRPVVTSVDDLRAKSEQVLDQHNVDYFTVLFDKVDEPELILVAHKGEDQETFNKRIAEATRLLKGVLPFAKGLHIREKTLDTITGIAGAELTRIPVTYSRIESGGYVTFFITGYITDYALSAVSDLVKGFSHDWGHRKVRFGLALKTTWLDGKSRQVGEDGYVLVDPGHWYFNNMMNGK